MLLQISLRLVLKVAKRKQHQFMLFFVINGLHLQHAAFQYIYHDRINFIWVHFAVKHADRFLRMRRNSIKNNKTSNSSGHSTLDTHFRNSSDIAAQLFQGSYPSPRLRVTHPNRREFDSKSQSILKYNFWPTFDRFWLPDSPNSQKENGQHYRLSRWACT